VAAARPAAAPADHHRGHRGARRAGHGAQPGRQCRDQPGRGVLGAGWRRGPGDFLRALGRRRAGTAAAPGDDVGRDVRRHGHPGRDGRDRAAAADRQRCGRARLRPPGELDRAGARAVAGGRGDLLHRGHRRRPAARGQARVVHRHGRGPLRDPVRLAAAGPVAHPGAVPRRRVHPGRRGHGPLRRAAGVPRRPPAPFSRGHTRASWPTRRPPGADPGRFSGPRGQARAARAGPWRPAARMLR